MNAKRQSVRAYLAAGVIDALGTQARPGAVIVSDGRIIEAARPDELKTSLDEVEVIARPEHLLMPMMVNVHAHLDLTDLGPRPFPGSFQTWLYQVIADRPTDPEAIERAVEHGVEASRSAGVEYLGDFAYSPTAVIARRKMQLPGVSYLECFGLGDRQAQGIQHLHDRLDPLEFETPAPGHHRGIVLGVAPHAPYTAGLDLYNHACELSKNRAYRLSSHVAETHEEAEFLRTGGGVWREYLEQLGVWNDGIDLPGVGPIEYLKLQLRRARWLLAHCNYVEDEHLRLLSRAGVSVAYCPVASDYFGHRGHRYRDMIEAGVNVCLGTDSILCQQPGDPQPMSILGQMRYLFRRDETDPRTLLKMGTTNGMLALELREADAAFEPGSPGLFAAVRIDPNDATDLLIQALSNDHVVEPIRDAAFDELGG